MEEFIQSLVRFDPLWIYAIILLFAYIENLFPPLPGDIIVVLGGSLSALGEGDFFASYLAAIIGGTGGFMTLFAIGKWFGKNILETGKIKFIKVEDLHRIEAWFLKYGFLLIAANRFLPGTRAVISFFAGVTGLGFKRTLFFSLFSSVLWYGILIYAGYSLGQHWEQAVGYLRTYSLAISITAAAILLAAGISYYFRINRR